MKKPIVIILIVLAVLAVGGVAFTMMKKPAPKAVVQENTDEEVSVVPADKDIKATVAWNKAKDNTVAITAEGLKGKYVTVAYELSYQEASGVMQGVTSRPTDVTGKESFTKDDIYLGTCSRNVCKPHIGVKKVTLVLEFKDKDGKKSQLSQDYDLEGGATTGASPSAGTKTPVTQD